MSNQKFRDLALFIVDIFVAVHKIKEYIQPFDNENDFRHSSLHWDATIRQLEVIGEALNNLLDDEEFSALSPKYFRKVVNFRNAISHGYFGIDLDEVWNVTHQHLPILTYDLQIIIKENKLNILEAIMASINEYTVLCDFPVIAYLKEVLSWHEQELENTEQK
ncbi:MAG: HepT-like ribonuclease domain-containing protein [Sulfuricurvum sp.]